MPLSLRFGLSIVLFISLPLLVATLATYIFERNSLYGSMNYHFWYLAEWECSF